MDTPDVALLVKQIAEFLPEVAARKVLSDFHMTLQQAITVVYEALPDSPISADLKEYMTAVMRWGGLLQEIAIGDAAVLTVRAIDACITVRSMAANQAQIEFDAGVARNDMRKQLDSSMRQILLTPLPVETSSTQEESK